MNRRLRAPAAALLVAAACAGPRVRVQVRAVPRTGAQLDRERSLCFAAAEGSSGSFAAHHDELVRVCAEVAASGGLRVERGEGDGCARVDLAWAVEHALDRHRVPLECAVSGPRSGIEEAFCASTARPVGRYTKVVALRVSDAGAGRVLHTAGASLVSSHAELGVRTARTLCRAIFQGYPSPRNEAVMLSASES